MVRKLSAFFYMAYVSKTCSPDRILHVLLGFCGPMSTGISTKKHWHETLQLAHFTRPCFVVVSPLWLFDWPRICSKSSVQNGAFDTLGIESIYASQRAILALLYHGCTGVAERYKYSLE